MVVTIDFTPQEQTWINTQIAQQGVSAADVIHKILGERLTLPSTPAIYKSPQERIQAMDALAALSRGTLTLPDEAFDRENIYEDQL